MYQVKEYVIKNEFILEKSNLKPAETYLRICQLCFLTLILDQMDPSCLPRQVIISQGTGLLMESTQEMQLTPREHIR